MRKDTGADLILGAIVMIAQAMFALERHGVAKHKEARGVREIDVSNLIAFGVPADEGGKKEAPKIWDLIKCEWHLRAIAQTVVFETAIRHALFHGRGPLAFCARVMRVLPPPA